MSAVDEVTAKLDRSIRRLRVAAMAWLSVAAVANLAWGLHNLEDGTTSGVVFGLWHLGLAAWSFYALADTPG